nr:clavaminate synthase-like protein At3g21360 isoform X2 [Erigeron canadensis]XP_043618535.1 clavaminate synthase-like protein At3g21360 isoform X2 [Erigeron canadensis]
MGNTAKVITGPVPAIRFNKESGRKTWFNSLSASYSGPASDKVSNEGFLSRPMLYRSSIITIVSYKVVLSQVTNPKLTPKEQLHAFEEAIRVEKPWLESLLRERGVILFRGFPVITPCDFNDVVEAFDYPEVPYMGGIAPRTKVVGRVYTANESPPDKKIAFHHEMSYIPNFPSKIFFYCDEAPEQGGETPIVLSHIIYDKMKEKHPEFVAKLEEHGLTYSVFIKNDKDQPSMIDGRGWKSVYNTDDKKVAEERAAKLGTKLEWMENSVKSITGPLPAIRLDKDSQRKTWFNNLTRPMNSEQVTLVELGNGDPVPSDALEDCSRILEEECVSIPWKKGDVMLVNNLTVLHSRRPLSKPPRRVLVSICK